MDKEDVRRMDNREYYEALLDTFSTPGWKEFLKDMNEGLQQVSSINGSNTLEDLWFNKGRKAVFERILSFEENTRKGLEDIEDNS